MSKRTAGEIAARKWWDSSIIDIDRLGKIIDALVRREKAKAWYEGFRAGAAEHLTVADVPINPYRGRKK